MSNEQRYRKALEEIAENGGATMTPLAQILEYKSIAREALSAPQGEEWTPVPKPEIGTDPVFVHGFNTGIEQAAKMADEHGSKIEFGIGPNPYIKQVHEGIAAAIRALKKGNKP